MGLLLVASTGEIVAQSNPDLKAMTAARQTRMEILSQRHDFSDERVRAEVVRQLRAEDAVHDAALRRRAQARGLPLAGDKPGGGRFQLVDFDENDQPVYDQTENANAAISTAANLVRATAPYNVTGAGVKIGLWEAGGNPRITHQELSPRATLSDSDTTITDHATHVAGTLAAAGIVSSARGMAPGATLACYNSGSATTEMTAAGAATPNSTGVFLSNHSYGSGAGWEGNVWYGTFSNDGNPANDAPTDFGRYSSTTVTFDGIAYNAPYYLIFISAGNHRNDTAPVTGATWTNGATGYTYDPAQHPKGDGVYKNGYDTIEGNKLGKNVLAVGAVNDAVSAGVRSIGAATIASFSSWGPADDGRIKPDIVANGYSLYSSYGLNDSSYAYSSGTSMSSPNACGSAALLVNYYSSRFPGGAMRASTLKALIIHTADDCGTIGPDYKFGWGLMNTKAAADVIKQHADNNGGAAIIESSVSTSIASRTHTFDWNGITPLRVTLAWTDPVGTAKTGNDDRTKALVNDLNLTVTRVGGATNYPYVMPYVGDWTTNTIGAAATNGVNTVDNVEQVYLASPTAGTYVITVNYAGSLSGGFQNYSLIVSGQEQAASASWGDVTENFNGVGGALYSKTTTTGGGTWQANSIVTDNGVLTANAGSAVVAFTPVANQSYTVSLDFNYSGGVGAGWLGLGFSTGAPLAPNTSSTGDRFSNANVPGYAWMLYSDTDTVTVYEGPNAGSTTITNLAGFSNGVHTMKIVLDTTGNGSNFTANFFIDSNSITGGPKLIDAVTVAGIKYAGFTQYGSGRLTGSTVDNFSLVRNVTTGFAGWIASYGLSGVNAATTNDFDGDGLNNLLEYAQNGNPTNAANQGTSPLVAGMAVMGGTNYFNYVHVERAAAGSGLTYTLEHSFNLLPANWTNSLDAVFLGEAVNGDYKTVTNGIPTDGKVTEFLRMKIESN